MKKYLITFRSVTPAQRGQRLLRQNGVNTTLQRTPRWMEERGCGYSLGLREEDAERAVALLRKEMLSYSKVYIQEDGVVTEMQL